VVTREALADALAQVPDPELPFLTIAELGMVGAITETEPGIFRVDLLPTYLGCPAGDVILDSVREACAVWGDAVRISWTGSPVWSTASPRPKDQAPTSGS
jgi:ring-1,2-phenylacetyl-CoA epoxidase subunit PaaD